MTTGEQIQLAVRAGLELGTSELQVQGSNHSAKKHWLLYIIFTLDKFLLFMKNLKLVFTRRSNQHTPKLISQPGSDNDLA